MANSRLHGSTDRLLFYVVVIATMVIAPVMIPMLGDEGRAPDLKDTLEVRCLILINIIIALVQVIPINMVVTVVVIVV